MRDTQRGLYRKFEVNRTDGRDKPGDKHHGCEYFVLDMTHDPYAIPAIIAYAKACGEKYPELSRELLAKFGEPATEQASEEWTCANERTVKWDKEQSKHLRERLASVGEQPGEEPASGPDMDNLCAACGKAQTRDVTVTRLFGYGDPPRMLSVTGPALECPACKVRYYDDRMDVAEAEVVAKLEAAASPPAPDPDRGKVVRESEVAFWREITRKNYGAKADLTVFTEWHQLLQVERDRCNAIVDAVADAERRKGGK